MSQKQNGSFIVNNGETNHSRHIDFGKKVFIPDPGERTGNDPCYLMSSSDLLKLINQPRAEQATRLADTGVVRLEASLLEKKDISEKTVSEVIAQSLVFGWSNVQLHGKQLLFIK